MDNKQILIETNNINFISIFNKKIVAPIIINNQKIEASLKLPLHCQKRVNSLLSLIPQFLKYEIDGSKIISIDVISSIFKAKEIQNFQGINGIIQYDFRDDNPTVNGVFKKLEKPINIELKEVHKNENFQATDTKKKIFFVTLDIGFIVCIIEKNYKKIIISIANTNDGLIGTITDYKPIRQLMTIQYAFQELDLSFTIYNNFVEIYSKYLKYNNFKKCNISKINFPIMSIEIKNEIISSTITHDLI